MGGLQHTFSASIAINGHESSLTSKLANGLLGDDYDALPISVNANLYDRTHPKSYSQMGASLNGNERMDEMVAAGRNSTDIHMSDASTGLLPIGIGGQSTIGGGSTLAEFTKTRNWPQCIMEELKDFLCILTTDGQILYLSPCSNVLTGYSQDELVGEFIVDFIHPDDSGIFVGEFNESIATGNPLRLFYRFRKKDDDYTIFECHGHPHLTSEASAFGPNNAAGFCGGFFMIARPYPTKSAVLLDSFLEHKIENERLTKRINDLKREEAEEARDA
ncbi:Cutinase gene palindrome-binding protein [Phlyctema vagabunda]|uniref:Cutinase gene palindrome-binding protein n=1 Tax=Phlyctema vagabunda TaxID=108571 RepID=A0ABR4P5B6_9HELO